MRTAKRTYPELEARDLLEMVTVRPARALKMQRDLGRISAGCLADAIAVPFAGSLDEVYEAIVDNRSPIEWMMINGRIAG
jgi:imidazolonepropionase-like amidohydrolase